MIEWDDKQLKAAGINKRKLNALIKRLQRVSEDLEVLGLRIYVTPHMANITHPSRPPHVGSNAEPDFGAVIAGVPMMIDGGDW